MTNTTPPAPFADWSKDSRGITKIVDAMHEQIEDLIFDLGDNTPDQYDAAYLRLRTLVIEALGGIIDHDAISE